MKSNYYDDGTFGYYTDENDSIKELFLLENPCIDAVRNEQDNAQCSEFFKILVLPDSPCEKARLVAQRGKLDDVKAKMLSLVA